MAKGKNFGLYFDGGTQINIGSATSLQLTDSNFTIEVWVKVDRYIPQNDNRDTAILGSTDRNGPAGSLLHLTIRNKRPYMGFFHHDTAGKQIIEERVWYHLAFVYNKRNQNQLIYVNGKLDADSRMPSGFPSIPRPKPSFMGKGQIAIGNCMSLNSFMLGQIRGLRIWNTALSQGRIIDSMRASNVPKKAPKLTAYWTFEDGFVNNIIGKKGRDEGSSKFESLLGDFRLLEEKYKQLAIFAENLNKEKELKEKEIKEKDFEISRLAEKVDRELTDKTGVRIATFISDANQQITEARKALKENDYNLGHVNLQFKMIPSETGDSVIFPSTDQIAESAGALSTIDIEFAPKESTKVAEIPTKEIPDVKGLTEVMARRKIAQAGFLTELKYQAVTEHKDKDRVVKQIPDPVKDPLAELNSTILILIGKEIN